MADLFTTLKKSAQVHQSKDPKEVTKAKPKVKSKPKIKQFHELAIHFNRKLQGFTIVAYDDSISKLAIVANILHLRTTTIKKHSYGGDPNEESNITAMATKEGVYPIHTDKKTGKKKSFLNIAARSLLPQRYALFADLIEKLGVHQYCKVTTSLRRLTKERLIMSLPHKNPRVIRNDGLFNVIEPGMVMRKVTSGEMFKVARVKDTKVMVYEKDNDKWETKATEFKHSTSGLFDIIKSYDMSVNHRRKMISKLFGWKRHESSPEFIEDLFKDKLKENETRVNKHNMDLWDCQVNAVARSCLKPYAVLHVAMGLGKSRMYGAACKCYGGKKHLLITEPQLVNELCKELKLVNIFPKVLKTSTDLRSLAEFNVASYTTLQRKSSRPGSKKINKENKMLPYRTIADDMKKIWFDTVVIDECHNIKNHQSMRFKYVRKLKYKHVVFGSGTVMGNTFGDLASYMQLLIGKKMRILGKVDGVIGRNLPYYLYALGHKRSIQDRLDSLMELDDGTSLVTELVDNTIIQHLKDSYSYEWTSNELYSITTKDTRIDLSVRDNFRNELQGNRFSTKDFQHTYDLVCVRLRHDHPEVLNDVEIPPHEEKIIGVKPTTEHVKAFRKAMKQIETEVEGEGGGIEMFAAIRRLTEACDIPQKLGIDKVSPKQELVLQTIEGLCRRGDKVICFTTSPLLTKLLEDELAKIRCIKPVALYSNLSVDRRVKDIDKFRFGNKNVLVSPYSLCGRGYNIPQASIVVEASQTWSVYQRTQAMARIIRPQQKKHPVVLRYKTNGMMDDYMINNSVVREADMEKIPDGIDRELAITGPRNIKEVIANVKNMLGIKEKR